MPMSLCRNVPMKDKALVASGLRPLMKLLRDGAPASGGAAPFRPGLETLALALRPCSPRRGDRTRASERHCLGTSWGMGEPTIAELDVGACERDPAVRQSVDVGREKRGRTRIRRIWA